MALLLSDAVDLNKAHHGDSKQPAEQEADEEKEQFVHTKSILSCGVSGGCSPDKLSFVPKGRCLLVISIPFPCGESLTGKK